MPRSERRYVTYIDGSYILMQSPSRYVNYSCEPNTFIKDYCDVTRRDIKKGEEITGDYSEDEILGFEIKCTCESRSCRGIIRRSQ